MFLRGRGNNERKAVHDFGSHRLLWNHKASWVLFIILSLAQVLDGYDFMIINSTNLFVVHTFWPNDPNPGAFMGSLTTWDLLGMVIGGKQLIAEKAKKQ